MISYWSWSTCLGPKIDPKRPGFWTAGCKRCDRWLGARFFEDAEEWQSAVLGWRRGTLHHQAVVDILMILLMIVLSDKTTPKGGITLWQWIKDMIMGINYINSIPTLNGSAGFQPSSVLLKFLRKRKWNGSVVQGRNSTFLAQRGAQLSNNFSFCGVCKYHRAPGILIDYRLPHDP